MNETDSKIIRGRNVEFDLSVELLPDKYVEEPVKTYPYGNIQDILMTDVTYKREVDDWIGRWGKQTQYPGYRMASLPDIYAITKTKNTKILEKLQEFLRKEIVLTNTIKENENVISKKLVHNSGDQNKRNIKETYISISEFYSRTIEYSMDPYLKGIFNTNDDYTKIVNKLNRLGVTEKDIIIKGISWTPERQASSIGIVANTLLINLGESLHEKHPSLGVKYRRQRQR